jgi:hypothetical protein
MRPVSRLPTLQRSAMALGPNPTNGAVLGALAPLCFQSSCQLQWITQFASRALVRALLEKLPRNELWRLGAFLLAAARDRLALRIEPSTRRALVHGTEADHHQGLVGLVGE